MLICVHRIQIKEEMEVNIQNFQEPGAIAVIAVVVLMLLFSKKIFIFPASYWAYRIYVIVVVALWANYLAHSPLP